MIKKQFNIDVYDQDIHYWEGKSMKKLVKKVKKEFGFILDINLEDINALFIWRGSTMVILAVTMEDKIFQDSILMHECNHATFRLLEDRGVPIRVENDEAFTYLAQCIYLKCKR